METVHLLKLILQVIVLNNQVLEKFETYPIPFRQKLGEIRSLILSVSEKNKLKVEETIKWGEPSYLVKGGSTIRYDWKSKSPNQCAMYFNCNTKLVDTFKELYSDIFVFEDNRAIVFNENDMLHEVQLKQCIELALRYHKVKHLPLLGANRISVI